MGVREELLWSYCLSAKKRSSCDAGIDIEFLLLYDQYTADFLSQNLPMCLNVKSPPTYSSTSHPKTSPANLRLLLVIFLVFPNTSSFYISMGHANCYTQGWMLCNTGVMIPPDSSLQTSKYFKYSGYLLTSILTNIEFCAMCCTRVRQSFSDLTKYRLIFMYASVVFVALWIGENSCFTFDISKYVCWSFPDISWNCFSLQYFILLIFLMRFSIFWHFSRIICIVNFDQSMIHPRISFLVANVN